MLLTKPRIHSFFLLSGTPPTCCRFNVALTRAKSLCIVVGNPFLMLVKDHWKALLQHCVNKNAYAGCPGECGWVVGFVWVWVWVWVWVGACVRVRVCVCVCVCACVWYVCVCVCACSCF